MITEYKYQPPIKYLFLGLSGLIMSTIFGIAIFKGDEIWFLIVIGIFFLMTLLVGIGFLSLFILKFNVGNLKLDTGFIEIPGRWRERTRIDFNDIMGIGEFDTYDHVIEIETNQGVYLIERNWMKKKEFYSLKAILKEYWITK